MSIGTFIWLSFGLLFIGGIIYDQIVVKLCTQRRFDETFPQFRQLIENGEFKEAVAILTESSYATYPAGF